MDSKGDLSEGIYRVALPLPKRSLFDYLPPLEIEKPLVPGMRVWVPLGKRLTVGIIFERVETSPYSPLKRIVKVCEWEPLFPKEWCDFVKQAAAYYHCPIGEVAFNGLPRLIKEGTSCDVPSDLSLYHAGEALPLNAAQSIAKEGILSSRECFQVFLLEGVTGSGKTEIYLQLAAEILSHQKQVLLLVPEISLTPQMRQRLEARFQEGVVTYHSRMTPRQRGDAWLKIRYQKAGVAVGTRSSLFLPFPRLGLVIVDEEHDPAFKQQDRFRYSARDMAIMRARASECPVILGSATPSLETLWNVTQGKYQRYALPERATGVMPTVTQIDVRHKRLKSGLSLPLLHKIEAHLERGGQILLFINRRGFAPVYFCYVCGWLAKCAHCDVKLTFHQSLSCLLCHHCFYRLPKYDICPTCGTEEVHPVGQGTEQIEAFLREKFPTVAIARIDSDTTRQKGALEKVLRQARDKEMSILIGTQLLAKGHHFPHVSLVGILDAEGGLWSVDFRATERMAQLLTQVAGRAGRVLNAAEVFIQTVYPDHPLLRQMLQQNYPVIANTLLEERRQCQLPPFSHWALVRGEHKRAEQAEACLRRLQEILVPNKGVMVSGPIPAPLFKRQGAFRYQLVLRAASRASLHLTLKEVAEWLEHSPWAKRARCTLDVDPVEIF